ncbi:MAG TPA: T9SS type A sorting domain-containing protein [Saprospiraceae bacterium]|nr:T9SS type A sorting domain-containing protein [Saprospiraceae bacterium]
MYKQFTQVITKIKVKVNYLIVLILLLLPLLSQAQKDVQIELLSPVTGQQILSNKPFTFKVRIKNVGNELISFSDPIGVDANVLGIFFYSTIIPHGDLVPGDTISFSDQISYNFTNDHPSESFCGSAIILGNVDPNMGNNQDCKLVDLLQHPTATIEHTQDLNQMSVYPNPSNGQFSIQYNPALMNNPELVIFNSLGQCIYSKKNITNNEAIDITGMPKGYYNAKITANDMQLNKWILLE